jgi:hypothetical protein
MWFPVLAGLDHYRPCFLAVDEDTHDEDKNKTNNANKGEGAIHIITIPVDIAPPLTACFRQVKLFLAFGTAPR